MQLLDKIKQLMSKYTFIIQQTKNKKIQVSFYNIFFIIETKNNNIENSYIKNLKKKQIQGKSKKRY